VSSVEAGSLLRGSSNAGFPFFTVKSKVREQLVEMALDPSIMPAEYPAIKFNRGTSHGPKPEDVNNRIVWGFPGHATVREMEILPVLQRATHWHPSRAAVRGPEDTSHAVNEFIKWSKEKHSLMFSTDFSGFDTSLKPLFLRRIMHQIAQIFQPRFADRINWVIENLISIPLLVGRSEAYFGEHGMPSGTGITSDGDSIGHRDGQLYLSSKFGDLNPYCQVQGDDGLLSFAGEPSEEDVIDGWAEIGLTDNSEKGNTSYDHVIYLRRWYDGSNAAGWYPLSRAASSIRFTEREHRTGVWTPEMEVIRNLSICQNAFPTPGWTRFMDFVIEGDEHSLGLGLPAGLDSISDDDLNRAATNNEIAPNYPSGREVAGLRGWESFKYVRELGGT
jgi:hypothetical protein